MYSFSLMHDIEDAILIGRVVIGVALSFASDLGSRVNV